MKLDVQFFAAARDLAGTDTLGLEVPQDVTVADLRATLLEERPELRPIAAHLLIAVDDDYAADSAVVPEGSRVACFPPVSGG